MNRRQFITSATATVAVTGITGCSGILGDGGGGGSGPDHAAEVFIEAAAAGDDETLQEYTHPEGEVTGGTARGTPGGASISVQSTEVLERSGDEATVAVTVEATQGDRSRTVEYEFDVRRDEDRWTVYSFTLVG